MLGISLSVSASSDLPICRPIREPICNHIELKHCDFKCIQDKKRVHHEL